LGTLHFFHGGKGRSAKRETNALSFLCLRHTATSLLKSAGISLAIVQDFVRHDSKAISENYTHIEAEVLRKAADTLPDLTP
jgi:integrase